MCVRETTFKQILNKIELVGVQTLLDGLEEHSYEFLG